MASEPRSASRFWLSDFEFRGRQLTVIKTGATARLDLAALWEVAIWLVFFACLQARVAWLALLGRHGPTIGFAPDVPRPWYLVRSAAAWGGMRLVPAAGADVVMAFEDATWSRLIAMPGAGRALNFGCPDISKSRVAAVFEQVFGYPLAIDPGSHRGLAVQKSEINSMHDGRLVRCPTERRAGLVYQRLVDTIDGASATDLRTPCVGGRAVFVWEKTKPADDLFSIFSRTALLRRPEQVFSADERAAIARFCAAMALDWGGLDILRDRGDGRIYIVDVNKTDVGPVIALSLRDKLVSIARLADALTALAAR